MFAPRGYVPAETLFHRLDRLGAAEISFVRAANLLRDEGSGLRGNIVNRLYYARLAFPFWAITRLLSEQPIQPYLASYDGSIVAAAPHWFFAGQNAAWLDAFSPLQPTTELEIWLEELRDAETADGCYAILRNEGIFIDYELWAVRWPDDIERRLLINSDLGDASKWVNTLKPFHGWAICFACEDLAIDDDALLSLLEQLGADIVIGDYASERSMPSLRGQVKEAFNRLYPDGRKGKKWKLVARDIEAAIGRTVSVKTVTRAVADETEADKKRTRKVYLGQE